MSQDKVYEMQWDCKYCGTNKLLGKTHRFCPNCGAAQDPDARYFPDDSEKVAVQDHVYVGADKICPACQTVNSASSDFCQQCGSPLDKATLAKTLSDDQEIRDGEKFTSSGARDLEKERFDSEMQRVGVQPKPGERSGPNWKMMGCLGLLAVIIIGVLVAVFWKQEASAYVSAHSWEREIQIEQYTAVSDNAWCDAMPADAYSVTRRNEQRSSRQIPDGEECTTRRVDQGDGTFREQRSCQTKYRSEPVYDDKCYFTVNRWITSRSLESKGESLMDAPAWPLLNLNRTGTCLGCEREGQRTDTYYVYLQDGDNTYTCTVSESEWASMAVESTWKFNVGVVTGQPDCSSLEPAS